MSEPIKIAVIIEGGLVQSVLSAGVPVEYVVIDYDTEGADDADLLDVPQAGGGTVPAFAHRRDAEIDGPFVLAA